MPKIKVQCTRKNNEIKEFKFEDYIFGVVASEIGNVSLEACKAQAVAARTVAWPFVKNNKTICDTGVQAFREERLNPSLYPNAYQAVKLTEAELLYYKNDLVSPCSFSASNGGRTTSSKQRWGGERPYLIEQDDAWDLQATKGKKTGHGVGMSQKGAIYAASKGYTYDQILSFYYPGTHIYKEGTPMASVKASELVKIFNKMASEKWKYVAGAHKAGEVDCSGAFYFAYKQLGGYMYHGSNTMWRRYTVEKDKIGNIELVPGMAVFKTRNWSESQSSNTWYGSDPGDVYHVGLYIGDGNVVEAKGVKHGVVITDISTWHLAATLKDTVYDLDKNTISMPSETFDTTMGVVKINSGWLNLRKEMSTVSERMGKLYGGDIVTVTGSYDDWYAVLYNNKTVYVKKNFIELMERSKPQYTLTITVFGDDELDRMRKAISEYGYKAKVTEGGAAA